MNIYREGEGQGHRGLTVTIPEGQCSVPLTATLAAYQEPPSRLPPSPATPLPTFSTVSVSVLKTSH